MLSVASSTLLRRTAYRVGRNPFYSTAAVIDNNSMVMTTTTFLSPSSWLHSLQSGWNNMLKNFIWNMSSTLKKRNKKMNKHKLRKRRKKLRRQSKK